MNDQMHFNSIIYTHTVNEFAILSMQLFTGCHDYIELNLISVAVLQAAINTKMQLVTYHCSLHITGVHMHVMAMDTCVQTVEIEAYTNNVCIGINQYPEDITVLYSVATVMCIARCGYIHTVYQLKTQQNRTIFMKVCLRMHENTEIKRGNLNTNCLGILARQLSPQPSQNVSKVQSYLKYRYALINYVHNHKV